MGKTEDPRFEIGHITRSWLGQYWRFTINFLHIFIPSSARMYRAYTRRTYEIWRSDLQVNLAHDKRTIAKIFIHRGINTHLNGGHSSLFFLPFQTVKYESLSSIKTVHSDFPSGIFSFFRLIRLAPRPSRASSKRRTKENDRNHYGKKVAFQNLFLLPRVFFSPLRPARMNNNLSEVFPRCIRPF